MPGSLLGVEELSLEDVSALLRLALELESEDPLLRARRLAKRRVALLFYESSTRTRTSFELAAKALGAEAIILRHASSGSPWLLEQATGLPVLNAGDGMHQHPSQALLDLRTLLRVLCGGATEVDAQTLAGVTITICGDILHSRVARSNALLLPRLGARVLLCGPEPLLPEVAASIGPGVEIARSFDGALARSRVVMMLRIQAERLLGLDLDLEAYRREFQLDEERIARHPELWVMHPGPMIRGLEIVDAAADGPRSLIEEQVRHGVAVRMALVARALGAGGAR